MKFILAAFFGATFGRSDHELEGQREIPRARKLSNVNTNVNFAPVNTNIQGFYNMETKIETNINVNTAYRHGDVTHDGETDLISKLQHYFETNENKANKTNKDETPGCSPEAWPQLETDYVTKGSVISLRGLDIYTVGRGSKCIIWNHDSYGFDSGRSRQFCDLFAAEGYFVIMPDYFRGEQAPPIDFTNLTEYTEFTIKHTKWEGALENDLVEKVMPYARENGAETFGAIGTCWGSYPVVKMSAWEEIKCGVSMHPSHSGNMRTIGEDEAVMLNAIKAPQNFMPSRTDELYGLFNGGLTEEILQDNAMFIQFPEMEHGWTIRGDMSIPNVDRDVKKAIADALDFIQKHL